MKKFIKGFAVVEILVVLGILGIIILIALPNFSTFRETETLTAATRDVLSSLNKARSDTLASIDSSEYGVHFQSDQVIIFKGQNFSAADPDNESIEISWPATISNVTLGGQSGTSGDVYFNRLTGASSTTGTVTVSTANLSKVITISATGAVSAN